jgi:hypothetical protein
MAAPDRWHGFELIAPGTHRICVRDPDDARYCLKFERPPHERPPAGPRERLRRRLAQRFPRFGDAIDARFARCTGLVATPHGLALRQRCVTDADGRPAPSLFALLAAPSPFDPERLCEAVAAFERWLIEHRVPLFDLNAGNFVVAGDAAAPRLVCIDSKSLAAGKEIVPLSRLVPALMRRKIARRAERLRRRIREARASAARAP